MAVKFICNAFSFNMIGGEIEAVNVRINRATLEQVRAAIERDQPVSAVGHADTAAVFSDVLGLPVIANRVTVSLNIGDTVLVGQYAGPRLPEGCSKLPAGATITWLSATLVEPTL